MDRRTLFTTGAGVLAGLLTGCANQPAATTSSAATGSPSASPATIGLTYIPNIQFAPFYVAERQGLFGSDAITLRHHGASEGLFGAIAAGQEQFVIAGGDEILQARSQGIDLVAIAAYYHRYPVAVLVKDTSGIRSLADLKGRKIGVPGRYGETWFGTLLALRSAGLTLSQVTIVEIGYTQQAALTTGKVDAVMGFVNNDQVQFGLAGLATRALPIANGTPPLVGICLATSRDFLTRQPDLCTRVADAMLGGIEQVVANPEAALEASAGFIPAMNVAAARATLTATVPLWQTAAGAVSGKLDPAQWQQMAQFLADASLTDRPLDAAEAFTLDHVSR